LRKEESSVQENAARDQSVDVPPIVHEVLRSSGQPLDPTTCAFMEPRFGHDFSQVRVHADSKAAESARAVNAQAYTMGHDIIFAKGFYSLGTSEQKILLAHELVHVVQQNKRFTSDRIHRYGEPIPKVANPTVTTMRQFIDLVRRIELANPGLDALIIAEKIRKTKYHTTAWKKLLPSTESSTPVVAGGGITQADVTTLSGEFTVTLPQGGQSDPSHIVAALVAAAEKKAPGWPISNVVPSSLTRLQIASWAGDIGSAAAEWMTAHPHPSGGTTMQNYMDEFAPESDLIADIDGVAMTSKSASYGFAFDSAEPLSNNLERFYYPTAPREGKNRRFHIFCSVEGLSLEADGITLSAASIKTINDRVHAFADFDSKNDPDILVWMAINSPQAGTTSGSLGIGTPSLPLYNPVWQQWVTRANDWHWFVQKFCDFLQKNLKAEGP
jgi:hypothetical protein